MIDVSSEVVLPLPPRAETALLFVGDGLHGLKEVLQSASFDVAASSPDEAILLVDVDTPGCVLIQVTSASRVAERSLLQSRV